VAEFLIPKDPEDPKDKDPRLAVIFDDVLAGWEVWIWLDHEHGMPIIHELRVAPPRTGTRYRQAKPGGLVASNRNKINLLTLSRRAFQEVMTHTEELRAHPQWEHWKAEIAAFETIEAARHAVVDPKLAGRRKRTPLYYAQVSAAYVREVAAGPKPYERMAEEFDSNADTMLDVVKEARRRGFLTKAPSGKAGGQLTKKANAILDDHKEEENGER